MMVLFTNITTQSIAQQQIQIKDGNTDLPIPGITFTYGQQEGSSDTEGRILFNLQNDGTIMYLSHVSYGTWEWDYTALKNILPNEVHYRFAKEIKMQPISIIAVHNTANPNSSISLVPADKLEHDAGNLLLRLPAIGAVKKGGNYGFDPVFRGYKNDQLNIVLDGAQCASAACPNRMDPPTSQMAPNMIDQVEILKGPHALRFGSGFGATINFVSSPLVFTKNNTVTGRVSTGFEHNGNQINGETRFGWHGNTHNINLYGAWSEGDDYRDGTDQWVPAGYTRGSVGIMAGLKAGQDHEFKISAFNNFAKDADFPALAMDLRTDDTWMLNASHQYTINKNQLRKWKTSAYASLVDHKMDNLLKTISPRMINATTLATTDNFGGRTEGQWIIEKSLLYIGADYRLERVSGVRSREFVMGPKTGMIMEDNAWQASKRSKVGLFAEWQREALGLKWVFAGRLDYTNADAREVDESFMALYDETVSTSFSPGLSLGVKEKIGNELEIGLWLGRAERSAGITELYINSFAIGQSPYELLGNPNLDPEVNNQIDFNLQWKKPGIGIGLDLFAGYLQNYISSTIDTSLTPVLPMSPGVQVFTNVGEVFKTGFELNLYQSLFWKLNHTLELAFTYAENIETNTPLPEIAPLYVKYTIDGTYLKGKLTPTLTLRYAGEQRRIAEEFGETLTPSYFIMDANIGYAINNHILIVSGISNLLNEQYYDHLSRSVRGSTSPIYEPGRSIYGKLTLRM